MSAFCRLPGKENQKGLLRKGSNAIPLVFQETVCSANAAGRGAEVGARGGPLPSEDCSAGMPGYKESEARHPRY